MHTWVLGEDWIFDQGLELMPLLTWTQLRSFFDLSWTQLHYSPVSYSALSLPHRFSPLSFHSWTLNLCSVFLAPTLLNLHLSTLPSPSISLFFVIRPASLNLLPIWVGWTSGSYLRGTILLFSPRTGMYQETLTICFCTEREIQSV